MSKTILQINPCGMGDPMEWTILKDNKFIFGGEFMMGKLMDAVQYFIAKFNKYSCDHIVTKAHSNGPALKASFRAFGIKTIFIKDHPKPKPFTEYGEIIINQPGWIICIDCNKIFRYTDSIKNEKAQHDRDMQRCDDCDQ